MHEQAALRRHIIGERERPEITPIEGDDKATGRNRQVRCPLYPDTRLGCWPVPLWVVELLLTRLDVDVRVGEFAKVELRTRSPSGQTPCFCTGMLLSSRFGRPSVVNPFTGFIVTP